MISPLGADSTPALNRERPLHASMVAGAPSGSPAAAPRLGRSASSGRERNDFEFDPCVDSGEQCLDLRKHCVSDEVLAAGLARSGFPRRGSGSTTPQRLMASSAITAGHEKHYHGRHSARIHEGTSHWLS